MAVARRWSDGQARPRDGAGARLQLFASGLTFQEIGEIRNIKVFTVRNAVSAVQKKLGFETRHQMVIWAVQASLVGDPWS